MKKSLIFGFGNIGRQDDGLGVRLSLLFEENPMPGVDVDSNYQLNVEDALTISEYDVVVFADASLKATAPFQMEQIFPASEISFTTHAMHPSSVLALCEDLYHKVPETYLLTIPGYLWDVGEEMSEQAKAHLAVAYEHLQKYFSTLLQ